MGTSTVAEATQNGRAARGRSRSKSPINAVAYEDITPERAQEYLDTSLGNRTIRQFKVDLIAKDIEEGNWTPGASDLVRFDVNGHLRDGHHRMRGGIQADKPFGVYVKRNCTEDELINVDTGVSRSAADATRLAGHSNANDLAVAARLILGLRHYPGRSFASRRFANRDIVDLIDSEPQLTEYVSGAADIARNIPSVTSGTVIALRYLFAKVDGEAAEEFFEKLSLGHGLEKDDPILALRRILTNNATATAKRRREEIVALLIIAFNKWRAGETAMMLRWGSNQPFPNIVGAEF